MAKNKIYMILTNGFDPDVRVYKEAKYLVEQDFCVEILCWDRKCEYEEDGAEEVMDGIKIKRFHILSQPGTGMKQLGSYLKFISKIRKYLKKEEYKYLHCHDFDGILTGLLVKKYKGHKLIFDMHEIYKNYAYAKNIFFDMIFKYILKKSDYIVYVNDEQINNFKNKIKEKLVYLPNYPEENNYNPIVKNKSKKIRVNYIGSLRDYNSLKALADITDEKIEIGFYGTGICFEKLKEKYQNTKVKLYGKYDGINESGEIYRNTDILYCSYDPSVKNWKNAYPVKLFEAIVTLTPIIVTDNTVAGDFVKKHNIGTVVEYSDSNANIEAINNIYNNYEKYVENIKKISQKYKWDTIKINLNKIYSI